MNINIGLSEENLKHVTALLSTVLANEMVLYTKTRKSHWNVSGESFMELHKLFEGQYKQLEESIDEIAERIGKLGEKAIGTMQEFMKLSSIKEHPGKYSASKDMLKELLSDHELVIVQLRKDIDICAEKEQDAGTADFLTDLIKQHETIAWTIRRYLN
jgi:starvation-inducible DNA-binding protein